MKIAKCVFLLINIFFLFASFVFAESFSSPNYKIFDESLNFGTAPSTSPNFKIQDSVGETAPGISNSPNYSLKGGFLQRIHQTAQNQNQPQGQGGASGTVLPSFLTSLNPDVTPPEIFNIEITPISEKSIRVTWQTNEKASSELFYGKTKNFELGSIKNPIFLASHAFFIDNLKPETLYYFQLTSFDNFNNKSVSELFSAKTLKDQEPPANVSDVSIFTRASALLLKWKNPDDSDFAKVIIIRKTDTFANNINEGEKIFEGDQTQFLDKNLQNDVTYYYTLFASDFSGNISSGSIIKGALRKLEQKIILQPQEPKTEQETTIPSSKDLQPKEEKEKIEKIEDFFPEIKSPEISPKEPFVSKIKQSFFELVDISVKLLKGAVAISALKFKEQVPSQEQTSKQMPLPIQSSFETLKDETITVLMNSSFTISIEQKNFFKKIQNAVAAINNTAYLLTYNEAKDSFSATIQSPNKKGSYPLEILVIFQDGTSEKLSNNVLVDPYGYVFTVVDNQELRLNGAVVVLYSFNEEKNSFTIWNAEQYGQTNPYITDKSGEFAFFVPKGKYYLEVKKENYEVKKTNVFEVERDVININIELKKISSFDFLEFLAPLLKSNILPLSIIILGVIILLAFIFTIRHIFKTH